MKDTFTISAFPDSKTVFDRIDSRMEQYIDGWQLKSIYQGEKVDIPGFAGSSFDIVKYFEVVKKPGDPWYRQDQRDNEIGMTIWGGWKGYDHEVEINLFIRGKDVLNYNIPTAKYCKVSAEILKCGGASMKLYHNDKLITDFTKSWWGRRRKVDKVWIEGLS